MVTDLHFLRPLWFLSLIPLMIIGYALWQKKSGLKAWDEICDSHLLKKLTTQKQGRNRWPLLLCLLASGLFFIISLSGPSWIRLPVPSFQNVEPRVIVLDLSENMLLDDVSPDRLTRAKFKLQDLFKGHDTGQWGMVVYTGEPFIVSPLTEDGQTIANLLPALTPGIMPVSGQNLASALEQAAQLIGQAGFNQGQILVISANPPDPQDISAASQLTKENIQTSIIPMTTEHQALFENLAIAGQGKMLKLTPDSSDLDQWLALSRGDQIYAQSQYNNIPLWRDEGRWFLIPALLFFLPLFRRGWLQGMRL